MERKKCFQITFLLSFSCLILIVLWKIFKWDIMSALSPFLYILILPVLSIILITVLTCCFIMMRKQVIWSSTVVIFLCIAAAAAPIDKLSDMIRFQTLSEQYNQVAEDVLKPINKDAILQTKNKSSNYRTLILDPELKHLSGNGRIYVFEDHDNGAIFFNAHRGAEDNLNGFVYLKNKKSDALLSDFGNWKQKKKIQDHWYYYSATE